MKKVILLGVVFMSILVSCKKEKEMEEAPAASEKIAVEEPVSEECYSAIIKKDTISMTLNIKGNELTSGKLSYNFMRKTKTKAH